MNDKRQNFVIIGIDRKIGERKKNGFRLETADGEDVGELIDEEHLKEIPTQKIRFKRMIDEETRNGFYLKRIDHKASGFLRTVFPTEQTGGIWDKYFLEDTPFEVGDVLRVIVVPRGDMISIRIEYHEMDQIREE